MTLDNPIYKLIGDTADRLGFSAYVVGGIVRDKLLHRPCTDIDIVCVGDGIQHAVGITLAREVAHALDPKKNVTVFKNFGTAAFTYSYNGEEWQVEFVGARRESYSHDSRKPAVEDGTLQDDQNRRDFTINAMAVSLNAESYGMLVDPFDGQTDLQRRIIRTPLEPDKTFSDDPLRMMRAVRFASQLGFDIAPETFEAIGRNAERINIVSMERISVELNKILLSARPSVGFTFMAQSGLIEIIFPELARLQGVETQSGRAHKDNFRHTMQVLDNVAQKSNNLWLRWAALLHDIGKPATKRYDNAVGWTFHGHEVKGSKMVRRIFTHLKLPLDAKMRYVEKMVLLHMRPIVLSEDIVTDSAVRRLLFEAGDDIDDLMTLCEADITSKNEAKVRRFLDNFALVRTKLVELEEKDRIRNFQPPVSGQDIMKIFGIGPCHEIGIIKDAIKDAILDGKIPNDREEALQMMYDEAAKLGMKPVDNE